MRSLVAIILSSILLLVATPAWGRVFIEWTDPALPSAASLGVRELVIPWGPGKIQLMKTARDGGFRVFALVKAQDAATAASAAASSRLAGIIVEGDSSQPNQGTARELFQNLRSAHPGLAVLMLDPGGKQPQIRGNLVVKRNGVLQVSSPTREPWIDSNLALATFERAFQPGQPPLFTFSWDLTDPLEQQQGPRPDDYALAVAEAGAGAADVVLPLHPNLQKALAAGDQSAWREWDRVKTYIRFYSGKRERLKPLADVAVITENYRDAYEAMNLLARRNITFRVLPPGELTAQRLSGSQMAIVFSHPDGPAASMLQAFASAGGTVLLIGQHGAFPWQILPAVKSSQGTTYKAGRGEVIESSSQPAGDPEAFAEQVRDLLRRQGTLIYLWNGVTTLSCAYRATEAGGMVLELVNYAQEPLEVQVRVKGTFPAIRYETPEHGSYPAATSDIENGFTQFAISHVTIGARVHLSPKTSER